MIEINATIIAQVINFLILVVLLRAVAYKPVVRLLEQRSNKIQESLDKAEKIARDEHDATILATKKEIEQMKKNAAEDIQRDRERAAAQLKGDVINISLAAAEKIIAKNIDTKENERLIGEFINQLDKEKLGDLSC